MNLEKKYGLPTAIAMVVGIVIGSGVFFKAEKVLSETGGNLVTGILAWIIGGIIMLICAYFFSIMATKYNFVNGLVDYAEVMVGKKYAYYIGWFMTFAYFPIIGSTLAWVSARYLCVILGFDITGGACLAIAGFFLVASFAMNNLAPKIAAYFQVSTTVIKLIPLFAMGIVGLIVGLSNGQTMENFTTVVDPNVNQFEALLTGVVASAFAYEGWIMVTSINAEIKEPKKNLPKALVIGSIIIICTYILYYVGLSGGASNQVILEAGEAGVLTAFTNVFGGVLANLLYVFIVVSCLGTLNGIMLGCTRCLYALAVRDLGPNPRLFKQVCPVSNVPTNSGFMAALVSSIWLVYFYGANLTAPWFGPFSADSSELVIVLIYILYLPIFVNFIKKEKELSFTKRYIIPVLSIFASLFMVFAAYISHGDKVFYFTFLMIVLLFIGYFYSKPRTN